MMSPPTEYSRVRMYSPPSMRDALAVVPPMSKLMTFSKPDCRAMARAPHDPRGRTRLDDVDRLDRGPPRPG